MLCLGKRCLNISFQSMFLTFFCSTCLTADWLFLRCCKQFLCFKKTTTITMSRYAGISFNSVCTFLTISRSLLFARGSDIYRLFVQCRCRCFLSQRWWISAQREIPTKGFNSGTSLFHLHPSCFYLKKSNNGPKACWLHWLSHFEASTALATLETSLFLTEL